MKGFHSISGDIYSRMTLFLSAGVHLSSTLAGLIMEINDELEIRIFYMLEQVKRMNEAIRRHQQEGETGIFMVDQFTEMKNRLTDELRSLLSQATETP